MVAHGGRRGARGDGKRGKKRQETGVRRQESEDRIRVAHLNF
jgi:hypothetical protein